MYASDSRTKGSVPSSINMLATLLILYILGFLVCVVIAATEIHNL